MQPFSSNGARLSVSCTIACGLLVGGGACSTFSTRTAKDDKNMKRIETVLKTNQETLMSIPGVVGVGIGGSANSPAIVVMLKENTPELKKKLPRQLGGFPVQVDVTGEVTAF